MRDVARMTALDPASAAAALRAGDRRALARAITLVESTREADRAAAEALLAAVAAHAGGAARLGVSGAPGVGKSTFIEAFGLHLIERGRRLAVLAIDPSGARGGGAILGDKTRMAELARRPEAFVRPSPSGGAPGGAGRRARDAVTLCEAAGYDAVIVETVGAGQSETAARDLSDMFVLLVAPGGGDELQGVKRGIAEVADLIVVTKDDGALAGPAGDTAAHYAAALRLMRPPTPGWTPRVLLCSALERRGLGAAREAMEAFARTAAPAIARRRAGQALAAMHAELRELLQARLEASPAVTARRAELEARVTAGALPPSAAARALVETFLAAS